MSAKRRTRRAMVSNNDTAPQGVAGEGRSLRPSERRAPESASPLRPKRRIPHGRTAVPHRASPRDPPCGGPALAPGARPGAVPRGRHQDVEATAWLPLREEYPARLQDTFRTTPEESAPLGRREEAEVGRPTERVRRKPTA